MELLHPLPFISLYFFPPLQQLQGFVQILDTIIGVINVFCICISFSFSPVARFKCYSNNVVKNLKDDLVLLQHFMAKDLHKSIFIYLGFFCLPVWWIRTQVTFLAAGQQLPNRFSVCLTFLNLDSSVFPKLLVKNCNASCKDGSVISYIWISSNCFFLIYVMFIQYSASYNFIFTFKTPLSVKIYVLENICNHKSA